MKNNFIFIIVSVTIGLTLLFGGCTSKKNVIYFQADSTTLINLNKLVTPILQNGDVLAISFVSDDERVTAPFNAVGTYVSGNPNTNNPFLPTYIIDNNGEIDLPQLGKVKVSGLSKIEAIQMLQVLASKYINKPIVNLKILNFQIAVLGEVKNPGTFNIVHDRITILEALALAGDMTISGVRKNVLVIRETNGKKEEFRLDLTNREVLNSPVYYLAQNDVVYVEPNNAAIQSASYSRNTSLFISLAGLLLTIVTLVTR